MATPMSDILQSDIESELSVNLDYAALTAAQKIQYTNTAQQLVKELYESKAE